jgi:hypothetical protein
LYRDVFIKHGALFLQAVELGKLLRPLYGLAESGDFWAKRLVHHHLTELDMTQTASGFSLFWRRVGIDLVGLSACYVDDVLQAGTTTERDLIVKTMSARFDMTPAENLPAAFTGLQLERTKDGYSAHMASYIARLQPLRTDAIYDDLVSLRTHLLWLANSRPDIACLVSLLSAVTKEQFGAKDVVPVFAIFGLPLAPSCNIRSSNVAPCVKGFGYGIGV